MPDVPQLIKKEVGTHRRGLLTLEDIGHSQTMTPRTVIASGYDVDHMEMFFFFHSVYIHVVYTVRSHYQSHLINSSFIV